MFDRLPPTKDPLSSATPLDRDGDGLDDLVEQTLAERFAPIVYHPDDEPNMPGNVDWFLARTNLRFCDTALGVDDVVLVAPSQADLHWIRREAGKDLDSYLHRDRRKNKTFYLEDIPDAQRAGPSDPKLWTTYFHTYPHTIGGVTIQYWRFHPYNSGISVGLEILGQKVEGGFHGGDWEGIHVVLDAAQSPQLARFLPFHC